MKARNAQSLRGVVAVLAAGLVSTANAVTVDYSATHIFTMPAQNVDAYSGTWNYQATAKATPGPADTVSGRQTWSPLLPPPAAPGRPPVSSDGPFSDAFATATRAVAAGAGGTVTGTVTASGWASVDDGLAPNSGASAWAYSKSVLTARGKLVKNGRVTWLPTFRATASGHAGVAMVGDPIWIDLDNTDPFDFELLRLDLTLSGSSDFSWNWNGTGNVLFSGSNVDLGITVTDSFGINPGVLHYVVTDGVVTTSLATGRFAGLDSDLPDVGALGSATALSFTAPSLDLDYTIPDTVNVDDATMGFGNDGSAWVAVPDSSSGMLPLIALVWLGLSVASRRRRST